MAAHRGEDVYASLLLTDTYLPGALVLAHSLRDAGTMKKLAVLVTPDSMSNEVITQLKTVYDYVIPVPRIRNEKPANLYLMDRPDLHSAFTKINLWKQTQFRRIVYIDADVVALRAPDELFDLPHAFAAAPDIGWPDLFNTGVMVLTPNLGDYYALTTLADRGISFDGADQGLLNVYFKDSYHRLSFSYNVTPSAHYQYVPAYRHFQSSINMVHFIGADKPWTQGRFSRSGSAAHDEMVGRWWAVYDRHYRKESRVQAARSAYSASASLPVIAAITAAAAAAAAAAAPVPEIIQYFVKGEFQPKTPYGVPVGEQYRDQTGHAHVEQQQQYHYQAPPPALPPPPLASHFDFRPFGPFETHPGLSSEHPSEQHSFAHQHETQHHHFDVQAPPESSAQRHEPPSPLPSESVRFAFRAGESSHTEAREEQASGHHQGVPPPPPGPHYSYQSEHHKSEEHHPQPLPASSWDAQRQPPPSDSKPEAANFPQTHYEMSSDTTPFVPPERYPSPPKNMWYDVPKEPPAFAREKPRQIFPWEAHQPAPTRVFPDDVVAPPIPVPFHAPAPPETTARFFGGEEGGRGRRAPSSDSETLGEPSLVEEESSSSVAAEEQESEPPTPTMTSSVPATSAAGMTTTLTIHPAPAPAADPFTTFTRTNAWDDVPEIDRYVETLQKQHRRTRSGGGLRLGGLPPAGLDQHEEALWNGRRRRGGGRGFKVTDFPSETDRPSLPVTPAPIRRPTFWGGDGPAFVGQQLLPAAEGVPAQSEWDPVAQLQKLARQQSELLLRKLGGALPTTSSDDNGNYTGAGASAGFVRSGGEERPFSTSSGSQDVLRPPTTTTTTRSVVVESPVLVSPQPVKPAVRKVLGGVVEQQQETATAAKPTPITAPTSESDVIAAPSYQGPGVAFEKGEDVPVRETPALPTEEERDVIET